MTLALDHIYRVLSNSKTTENDVDKLANYISLPIAVSTGLLVEFQAATLELVKRYLSRTDPFTIQLDCLLTLAYRIGAREVASHLASMIAHNFETYTRLCINDRRSVVQAFANLRVLPDIDVLIHIVFTDSDYSVAYEMLVDAYPMRAIDLISQLPRDWDLLVDIFDRTIYRNWNKYSPLGGNGEHSTKQIRQRLMYVLGESPVHVRAAYERSKLVEHIGPLPFKVG